MADHNDHAPILNGNTAKSDHISDDTRINNGDAGDLKVDRNLGTLDEIELKSSEQSKDAKDLLIVPAGGPRKSFMEEESARERARQSLLKQCSAILKQTDERYTKETLHKAFQDEDLLERIFRLFDSEGRRSLEQERWLEFLRQRLAEEKQLDFLEQVESVAYVVCGAGDVSPLAFRQVLSNRVVTNKLLKAVDADGDGCVSADEIMNFLSTVTSSRSRAGFDKASVDRLEQLFKQTVGEQQEITKDQFSSIVDSKNAFFRERVFHMFDADHSGTISLQEFISAAHRFAGRTPDDKLRFLFEIYDMDGDGLIQQRELQHALWACMDENGMKFSEEQLEQLTQALLEDADDERRGAVTYEGLRRQLGKHDGLLENLSISIDRWLVPPKPEPAPTSWLQRLSRLKPYQLSLPYLRNNYVLVAYLIVFALINIGLFAARCVEFQDKNVLFMIAKACGQCLNFNCVWVLVLMLRRCITVLRVRGAGALLPLDHHMYLHKLTGGLLLLLAAAHTAAHLAFLVVSVVPESEHSLWQLLSTHARPLGLAAGAADPTGAALVLVLLVMFVCSQPFIRRRGNFEIFYWTHLLYVPFWLLLVFHGPNFWKWFVLPGAIYVCEKIIRLVWLRSGMGKTYVSSGILLPSQVTHLVVKRPPLFEFHAGDYVFVNIPAIAGYEWHPFTISSAPDQPDYIWLHVRAVGEWTGRLRAYFERAHGRLHAAQRPSLCATSPGGRRRSLGAAGRAAEAARRATEAAGRDNRAYSPDLGDDETGGNTLKPPGPARAWLRAAPLRFQKTRSMPDVHDARRQRNSLLREYVRSESECRLERPAARRAPGAGGAPLGRALADSFRYMRHKPAVVAFRPPAQDARRRSDDSLLALARRLSKISDKDVEAEKRIPETTPEEDAADSVDSDYPAGKPLELFVDGPYGAASSRIFRAQHAVLVAAGIGVTPFASILRAAADRLRRARSRCPRCQHEYSAAPPRDMLLNKVDFFWINREQRSFEWFVSLLSQLEIEQAEAVGAAGGERFLDMHMYITSALQRTDMKAVGLQLALDLLHEKEKRDLITGLKTRTNAGRPNWDKVFKQLEEQRKGKVTVFFCGPPQLARVLRVKCNQFGFHFRKEVF